MIGAEERMGETADKSAGDGAGVGEGCAGQDTQADRKDDPRCAHQAAGLFLMAMDTIEPLTRDFVEWVAREPRSHADVMNTWRTSCPRFTVWEDARDRGLVGREHKPGRRGMVVVTPKGRAYLAER
jgi:hypothetical protein